MLIFHALARLGYEGLVIVSPGQPLASIGYFQDAEKEIDLDYCKEAGISVMRREVGGGATYLDENQIFYQVIWNSDNTKFPRNIKEIFQYLSFPPCETYGKFGINTSFRAENDIITDSGKKIAGEGGGDIGNSMVFVGGILMDFDYVTMSRVLKVPDEKFRDKIYKSMEENLHHSSMMEMLCMLPEKAMQTQAHKEAEVIPPKQSAALQMLSQRDDNEAHCFSPAFSLRQRVCQS